MSCDYKMSQKSAHCLEELKGEFTVRSCLYFSFLLLLNQKTVISEPARRNDRAPSQMPIRQASNTGSLGQVKELRANCLTIFWSKLRLQGTYSQCIKFSWAGCLLSWSLKTALPAHFKRPQAPFPTVWRPDRTLCSGVLTRQVGVVLPVVIWLSYALHFHLYSSDLLWHLTLKASSAQLLS